MKDLYYLMRIYVDLSSRLRIVFEWMFDPDAFHHRVSIERRFYNKILAGLNGVQ